MFVLPTTLVVAKMHRAAFVTAFAALVDLSAGLALQEVDGTGDLERALGRTLNDFNQRVRFVHCQMKCATIKSPGGP